MFCNFWSSVNKHWSKLSGSRIRNQGRTKTFHKGHICGRLSYKTQEKFQEESQQNKIFSFYFQECTDVFVKIREWLVRFMQWLHLCSIDKYLCSSDNCLCSTDEYLCSTDEYLCSTDECLCSIVVPNKITVVFNGYSQIKSFHFTCKNVLMFFVKIGQWIAVRRTYYINVVSTNICVLLTNIYVVLMSIYVVPISICVEQVTSKQNLESKLLCYVDKLVSSWLNLRYYIISLLSYLCSPNDFR